MEHLSLLSGRLSKLPHKSHFWILFRLFCLFFGIANDQNRRLRVVSVLWLKVTLRSSYDYSSYLRCFTSLEHMSLVLLSEQLSKLFHAKHFRVLVTLFCLFSEIANDQNLHFKRVIVLRVKIALHTLFDYFCCLWDVLRHWHTYYYFLS